MDEHIKGVDEEFEDLKQEMEDFQRERERVKAIVGKIGGVPRFNAKLFNILFATAVFTCLVLSLLSRGTLRLAMLELATAALSIKLIYIIHNQARVNHFELWILSSLEWRVNELHKKIDTLKKKIENISLL